MEYIDEYIEESGQILANLDRKSLEKIIGLLLQVRQNQGRLFFMGVGGGAGHASHAVNDFRKIAGFEAYAPSDNISELTARVNDDGWDTSYSNWLMGSRLNDKDMVFVFSVGGGDVELNVSPNIVKALSYARQVGALICGVVGPNGGFTAQVADACVKIPVQNTETVTPHTEAYQAVVWHLLVSHPSVRMSAMKWESIQKEGRKD